MIADYGARRPSPLTDIVVWHQGGAMSRVGETDTAYGGRDAAFLVTGEASWDDPALNEEAIGWGRAFWDAIGQHSTGGMSGSPALSVPRGAQQQLAPRPVRFVA